NLQRLTLAVLLLQFSASGVLGCDLCAIYRATNARGESSAGFQMTLSEQYIEYGTLQKDSERYDKLPYKDAYLDTSITHIVPAYNFSDQFGISLNIPLVYRDFRRIQTDYPLPPDFKVADTESGSLFGLGDVSLIGRWTP